MTRTQKQTDLATTNLATRWVTWSENGLPDHLDDRLRAIGTYSEMAVTTISELAAELGELLERWSGGRAVDHFLAAPTAWIERCDRWATLCVLELLSRLPGEGLERPAWQAPSSDIRRRILTEVEIALVRHVALGSPMRTATIGALDGGVVSGELPRLLVESVRVDLAGQAAVLDAPGTQRESSCGYPVAEPRVLEIPAWSRAAFAQLTQGAPFESLLLYGGTSSDEGKIQSSILMVAGKALAKAGLSGDPTVKPLSIRNTAARRVYEANGLEAAAAFLGHADLMSVAREIGIREHRPARMR